jgi:hypothetical protein
VADQGGVPDADADWRQRRSDAASAHSDALERRRAAETVAARALIADFVRETGVRGPAPVRLHARSYDGRSRYRTGIEGWYLRRNQTVGIGTDGAFYVLSVPRSLRSTLSGASVPASDPPLILGKGGRDGESIDLADALALVLGDAQRRT